MLAVSAVVRRDELLLLVQRARPPAAGRWALPGGRVEEGEVLVEAVVRELAEETGLDGLCGPRLGILERITAEGHHVVVAHLVDVLDPVGELRPGDDASQAAWFHPDEVSGLPLVDGLAEFLHDHGVLAAIT